MNKLAYRARKVDDKMPDVFHYHDYREFMRDWLSYARENKITTLRKFSKEIEISPGHFSSILSGRRSFSDSCWQRVLNSLKVSAPKGEYLSLLRQMSDSEVQDQRVEAFHKLKKVRGYKSKNSKELLAYQYLSKWYYVAIREMVNMEGFQLDAQWIQRRLEKKVSYAQIREAIDFLLDNEYIEQNEDGEVSLPEASEQLKCSGSVYRLSLAELHSEILNLSRESIVSVPRERRSHVGYALSIQDEDFEEVRDILNSAIEQIKALERRKSGTSRNSVFQISLSAFPLTCEFESAAGRKK